MLNVKSKIIKMTIMAAMALEVLMDKLKALTNLMALTVLITARAIITIMYTSWG